MTHAGAGNYRPDIDGPRAVAVAIVLLHHVRLCRGGFIGVDIFFVISGFLIASIILREIEAGTFSLREFYGRRARRIFPALFAVLFVSSLTATLFLFPGELVSFGKSLLYATFFVANIYFYQEQGYFSLAKDFVPLLHTWSLSVEEQFYIVLPFLLLLAFKIGRKAVSATLCVLFAASLAMSIYLVEKNSAAAFFLFPPRAWELLLGCLLAARSLPEIPGRYRESITSIALVAILIAAFTYDDDTPFPGWHALIPCLAAAALIHAGNSTPTRIGHLLSSRPFVSLGLVSYSLYLWHWPLIVFYRSYTGHVLSAPEKILLCVASLVLAYFSWRFIEQPFRKGSLRITNAFAYSALAAVVSCTFAGIALATDGLPGRYPESVRRIAAFEHDAGAGDYSYGCWIDSKGASPPSRMPEKCLAVDATRKNFLLMGDSHARHYRAALNDIFPEANIVQATASGCKPTIEGEGVTACRSIMKHEFDEVIPRTRFDAIVLSARWERKNLADLLKTVDAIGRYAPSIVVLGPIVVYDDYLPRLLARAYADSDLDIVREARNIEPRNIDRAFADAFRDRNAVQYVSVIDFLCGPTYDCKTLSKSGLPLQFDRSHLTNEGATEIIRMIRDRNLLPIGN